jgi:hypothetical protein
MSESRKIARSDATDIVVESGLTRSRQILSTKAMHKDGPPFTYGPHGAVYDEQEVRDWIATQKAKRGMK